VALRDQVRRLSPRHPYRAEHHPRPHPGRPRLDACFPTIAAAARELNVHTAILDREAVVLGGDGRSDFGAPQRSLGGRGGKRVQPNPCSWPSTSSILTDTTSPQRNYLCAVICLKTWSFQAGTEWSLSEEVKGVEPNFCSTLADWGLKDHSRSAAKLSIRPDR
jgi:hypothetical protein